VIENPATLIPPGEYECVLDTYHGSDPPRTSYPCFRITKPWDADGDGIPDLDWPDLDGDGRPDRDLLKIHRGNYAHQSRGCPLLGMERGYVDEDVPAVWRSTHAHGLYMAALQGHDRHRLIVTESRA